MTVFAGHLERLAAGGMGLGSTDPFGPVLLFGAVGLLLIGIGWPLASRRVGPNRWYGLRVPATFADEQVWCVLSLGLPAVVGLRGSGFAIVAAAVLVVGSLLITVRGWRAANRLLRNRRSGGISGPSGSRAGAPGPD
jgi:hypothetical protein